MIELVVFDMAGTTVDENNVVYKTVHQSIVTHGYEVRLEQVLEMGAGKEKRTAIADILSFYHQMNDQKIIDGIFDYFKSQLERAYELLDVKTFEGTMDVFDHLRSKNIKIVLNTGYDRKTANTLLNKLHWVQGQTYDLLVTADDVQLGRPHPDMILLAMKTFNISDPLHVIKVGDSAIDIEEGKAAHCGITIGVLTGAQNYDQLSAANPNYIVESLDFLKSLI